MGQHSGSWAYLASILFAATVISLCVSIPDRGASAEFGSASRGLYSSSLRSTSSSSLHPPDGEQSGGPVSLEDGSLRRAASGLILSVPRNALVVIGSVDLSGAPHIVAVDSDPLDFVAPDVVPAGTQPIVSCLRLSSSDVTLPNATSRLTGFLLMPKARDLSGRPKRGLTVSGNTEIPTLTPCLQRASPLFGQPLSKVRSCDSEDVALSIPDGPSIRSFLVPHFEQETAVNEAGDATLIAQSPGVSVYLDHSLRRSAGLQQNGIAESQLIASANEVCQRLEAGLLDHVTMWIGPIADLDGDQRLTIVITDLDRREPLPDASVLGCVRDRDFLKFPEADRSGDIVYLDRHIPDGNSLDALLAHELTHAAVFSLMLQSSASDEENCGGLLPSWLNEATAHLVESSVTDSPAGFAERLRQFHADTSACPIVASASYLSFSARRGGSRVSGASFLRQFAKTPDALRSLIQSPEPIDRRLESIAGRPFSEVFRTWSVGQAQAAERSGLTNSMRFLAQGDKVAQRVFGTAFFCFRCVEPIHNLRIASDSKAALQITVIEQQ